VEESPILIAMLAVAEAAELVAVAILPISIVDVPISIVEVEAVAVR